MKDFMEGTQAGQDAETKGQSDMGNFTSPSIPLSPSAMLPSSLDSCTPVAASSKITQYKVTIWEIIAIVVSALLLASAGLTGLAVKFTKQSFDPKRAEAIAKHIMTYELPSSSQGLLGINIAGAKVAVISTKNPNADVELLVARVPLERQTDESQIEQILNSSFLGEAENEFKVTSARTEDKKLCDFITPVTIQEGQLIPPNKRSSEFAVSYRATVVRSDKRYFVIILTSGEDALEKADSVFDSLKCK
jgi:hypothetical protein